MDIVTVTDKIDPTQATPSRLDFIDGLRAIAMFLVLLDHIFLTSYPLGHIPKSWWGAHTYWFLYGHYGVALFIILSGFCLMLPVITNGGYLKGGFSTFIRRRAWRILPPYYLSMCACFLLVATVIHPIGKPWDTLGNTTPIGFILHLLLLHHLTRSAWAEINGVYWSLGVEWWIYFFFPLLLVGWRRVGSIATVALTAIVGVGLYLPTYQVLTRACPQFIALFAVGMLAADISFGAKWQKLRDRLPWGIVAAVGLGVLITLYAQYDPVQLDEAVGDLGMACFVGPVLIAASKPGKWRSVLSVKPLVFIGSFSYSIYLMHLPFIHLFWQQFIAPRYELLLRDKASIILLVIGTPVVMLWSFLFYLAFEKPFLTRRSWRSWGVGSREIRSVPID